MAPDILPLNNDCPSSEWEANKTFLDATNNLLPLNYSLYYGPDSPDSIQVTGKQSLRTLSIHRQPTPNESANRSVLAVATGQQAAIADALTPTAQLWLLAMKNGSIDYGALDDVSSVGTGYYQPYNIADCEYVVQGRDDERPVVFPLPPGSGPQMLNTADFNNATLSAPGFVFSGMNRSMILDVTGPAEESRLQWIELPQNPFNGTAIGAVVLLPRSSENLTQEILLCNIGAGWGASNLNVSSGSGVPQAVQSQVQSLREEFSIMGAIDYFWSGGYFPLPSFPQKPIALTAEWANYLNPFVPFLNSTVFNCLMTSNLTIVDAAVTARTILAGLTANGLARLAPTSRLQGTVKTITESDGSQSLDGSYWFSGKGNAFGVYPIASKDWVKFRINTMIETYAYNSRGATTRITIRFIIIYCVVAVAHILYALVSGISSTCWDSIGEVTALAMNLTPTTALRNTCAGITELDIYKLPVRVLAVYDEQRDRKHLELVFGHRDGETVEDRTIKANKVYDTIPSLISKAKVL